MNIWQWIKVRTVAPNISKTDALSIARAECERRDWLWWEPVHIKTSWGSWEIWTNADEKGGNVRILVSKDTGEIAKAFLLTH